VPAIARAGPCDQHDLRRSGQTGRLRVHDGSHSARLRTAGLSGQQCLPVSPRHRARLRPGAGRTPTAGEPAGPSDARQDDGEFCGAFSSGRAFGARGTGWARCLRHSHPGPEGVQPQSGLFLVHRLQARAGTRSRPAGAGTGAKGAGVRRGARPDVPQWPADARQLRPGRTSQPDAPPDRPDGRGQNLPVSGRHAEHHRHHGQRR
jgi:hypothetical protein